MSDAPSRTLTLPLDHVVIAVRDLACAIADYRSLGFQVLPGGQHPGRTSHNALVVFADGAYLELIAWQAPAPQERWWRTLQDHGEGLVDFALLPAHTEDALRSAQARGLHTLHGPVPGARKRPDGAELKWQTARHATPDLPFLCGDLTPRALRVPEGPVRQHRNGVLGVAELTVAVQDLSMACERYAALLGGGGPHRWPDQGDGVGRAQLWLPNALSPGTRLTLVSPTQSQASPCASALAQRLRERGEGPCALALAGPPGHHGAHSEPFAAHLSHGVDLRWSAWPAADERISAAAGRPGLA